MSNDVIRWTTKLCEHVVGYRSKQHATYPPAPSISSATVRSICDKTCEDKIKCKNNSEEHRNVYNDDDDDDDDDVVDDDEPFPVRRKNVKIFVSNFLMKSICNRLVFLYILVNLCNLIESVYSDDLLNTPGARGHFTQQWAVHIPGGNEAADRVAADHGFINLGKIFDDHYHFHHNSVSKRSINPSHHHQNRLDTDDRVRWSKQQRAKSRQKRDLVKIRNTRPWSSILLNDPKWPLMWYLNRGNGLDMNVIPAWKEGITGKGVVVTILDDGLESTHPDLEANYDPKASYDVNSHDDDPMPHYDMTDSNRHGTRCAGEVAATANNSQCAVGIAFGARVGGVRMLDGDVTDAVEARSLSLNPQHIDIYSASWGPDDDGKTVDGPGELATRAFVEGITSGRNGKGSIFIWASGNGGRENDNCNCDGYTNSIWTLSISSATEEGAVPWYSEMCSSTLATTYSSGSPGEKQVVTTDLHHSCTSSHTGTSASAPLAAGIAALVLEANRNLTWRDLQHIVVRTAKPGNLKDPNWAWNGVARKVSHSFGYGLMDAAAMVKLARVWKTVPEQHRCEINAPHVEQIPAKTHITLQLPVKHCRGVNYLEHVQAKISLTAQRRGDIHIYLTSPAGTRVTLLTTRSHDVSRSGFNQWPFMSVHTWGEAPHGNWHLEIHNEGRYMGHASFKGWSLILYGSALPPVKSDPPNVIRHPTHAPNVISYSITKQPKGGRKQQFGQTPSYSVLTPPRKNNKNKNGKSNNKKDRLTTPRPNMTTLLMRKYDYNAYSVSGNNNRGTTLRPKQSNINIANGRNDKLLPSFSVLHEKSAIKAPKQVKEHSFATTSTTAATTKAEVYNQSSNSRLLQNIFQKYDKIQHTYPEFHPYTGPRDSSMTVSNTNTNGKPSRENSKSIFYADNDFFAAPPQKKANQQVSSFVREHTSRITSSQRNGQAQIQQWDMIMYGTEVSAQPDDLPPPKKPTLQSSGTTNSLDHNSLEFDTGTASGQWRNTQQVGESQHQRTTSSDLTSTACKTYSSDHKCIECQHNTYLYNGLCLSACPDDTYIVPEQPISKTKYRQRTDGDDVVSLSLRSDDDSADFSNLDDLIVPHSSQKRPRDARIPQKYCADCHPNCLTCFGASEMQCKTCRPDYYLITVSPGLLACQPNNDRLIENLDDIKTIKFNWKNLTIYETIVVAIFIMLTILLLSLGLYFALKKFTCVCLWLCSHRKNEAGYSKIEMDEKSGSGNAATNRAFRSSKDRQLQLLENDDDEDSSDDLD